MAGLPSWQQAGCHSEGSDEEDVGGAMFDFDPEKGATFTRPSLNPNHDRDAGDGSGSTMGAGDPPAHAQQQQQARLQAQLHREFKYTSPDPLFDPDEDDETEKWMTRKRAAAAQMYPPAAPGAAPVGSSVPSSAPGPPGQGRRGKGAAGAACTAHLSCPCCFCTVSTDCVRFAHASARSNLWRTPVIPMACAVDMTPVDADGLDAREGGDAPPPGLRALLLKEGVAERTAAAAEAETASLRWWTEEEASKVVPAPLSAPAPEVSGSSPLYKLKCGECGTRVGWYAASHLSYVLDCVIPSEV